MLTKDDIQRLFARHEEMWQTLQKAERLTWISFPWPLIKQPSTPEDITTNAVDAYILSPYYPEKEKDKGRSQRDRIKEHIRRWHPDRFDTKLLPRVVEGDRENVKEGAGAVVRGLNDLLRRANTPNPFD